MLIKQATLKRNQQSSLHLNNKSANEFLINTPPKGTKLISGTQRLLGV